MNKKEAFLRAIQTNQGQPPHDATLTFRWALNLKSKTIPPDIQGAARNFIQRMAGAKLQKNHRILKDN